MLSKKLLLLSVAASLIVLLESPTAQAYNNADLVAVQKGASCPGGDLSVLTCRATTFPDEILQARILQKHAWMGLTWIKHSCTMLFFAVPFCTAAACGMRI